MQRAIGGIGIVLANGIDDLNMLLITEVIVLMQLFFRHRGVERQSASPAGQHGSSEKIGFTGGFQPVRDGIHIGANK